MSAALDIEARLKELESVLGQTVFLTDQPEDRPESLPQDEELDVVQRKEGKAVSSKTATITPATPKDASATSDPDEPDEMRAFSALKTHELSDERIPFCPWKLVKGYPDFFTGNANRERVRPFFDDALKNHDWYFLYIRDTRDPEKAHLLVPSRQVENLLKFINKTIGTALTVPHGNVRRSSYLRFSGCGSFRPRFLLHHKRQAPAEALAAAATSSGFDIDDPRTWPKSDAEDASKDALAELRMQAGALLNTNMELMRSEPGGSSKLTAAQRFGKRKERRKKEMQAMHRHLQLKDGVVDQASDVVFFCVDVEALEEPPGHVSEIGIAILDMQRVGEQSPGRRGQDWWPLLQAHHLRIKEYARLRNYRYVHGCPEEFNFGDSTFPSNEETPKAVMAILQPYLDEKRPIVLVGHDIKQDIIYMNKFGFDLQRETQCVGMVDSQTLYQVWMQTDDSRSLGTVLDELGFEYRDLHNAGNDAVYTLRAAIGVAFAVTEPASPA